MARSRILFKCLLIAGLAAGAAAASASAVSIDVSSGAGPYSVGDPVTFSVSDGNPRDMCDFTSSPFCAGGDFRIKFDCAKLSFDVDTGLTEPLVSLNFSVILGSLDTNGTDSWFDVSVLPLVPSNVPNGTTKLFSLTFKALAGPPATVYVYPSPYVDSFDNPFITYDFIGASATVNITSIPEPSTYALIALALAAMGGATRRRGRSSV